MTNRIPEVVIVGGGFGGLAAAKVLKKAPIRVTLIERANHHVFQPLLYQVATSILTPGQIASPIREILGKQKNVTLLLGEVTGLDKDRKCVFVNSADRRGVAIYYDYLVLATGVDDAEFKQFCCNVRFDGDLLGQSCVETTTRCHSSDGSAM